VSNTGALSSLRSGGPKGGGGIKFFRKKGKGDRVLLGVSERKGGGRMVFLRHKEDGEGGFLMREEKRSSPLIRGGRGGGQWEREGGEWGGVVWP